MAVINRTVQVAMASVWVLSIAACGGGGGGGPTTSITVSGVLYQRSSGLGSTQSKLSGATVQATVNGAVLTTATSDAEGAYSLTAAAPTGATVVMNYSKSGLATQYRTLLPNTAADLRLNVTLHELQTLTCNSGNCALDGNKLTVNGLPSDAAGSGRVFNPVTEASAFPGSFSDNNGNLLISGVFSAVSLTSSGQPLTSMSQAAAASATAELGMKLPRETWSIIQDENPVTTDRVEVPLYAFDQASGQWRREGQGILVDDSGAFINATTDLTAVKAGTWTKGVNARGDVAHFSYWNVDWPIDKHTCLTAQVLTAGGAPAVGATVSVSGVSYNGTTTPQTTGSDGRFCADVMKSEGGTNQTVRITVYYQGEVYAFGPFDTSSTQATCGTGSCTDVGPLRLTADKKLAVQTCTISGNVVSTHGIGVGGATVFAFDNSVPDAVYEAQCTANPSLCFPYTTTDGTGHFAGLQVLMLEGVTLWSYSYTSGGTADVYRYGQRELTSCPTSDVTITLSDGYTLLTNVAVTVSGNLISWTPNTAKATLLYVMSSSSYKWMIGTDTATISSPVTYGTVPAGAVQYYPTPPSAPSAMAPGDTVWIWISGTDSDGFPLWGSGTGTVP